MKNLDDLFDFYRSRNLESVFMDNMARLGDAVEIGKYVKFTEGTYIPAIECLILKYTLDDTKNVVKCLSSMHKISYNEAKLLLIKKLTETTIKITEMEVISFE